MSFTARRNFASVDVASPLEETVVQEESGSMSPAQTNLRPRHGSFAAATSSYQLGSLTEKEWEDALASLIAHVDKALVDINDNNDNDKASGASSHVYWINAADKLLRRLQAELATQSLAARQRRNDVLQAQLYLLNAWCVLGRQYPDHRALAVAAERASQLFWNIVQRSKTAWWKTQETKSTTSSTRTRTNDEQQEQAKRGAFINSLLDLLEIYARKQYLSDKNMQQATSILLWKDLPTLALDAEDIGPMYGILTQQVEFTRDQKTTKLLQQQWQQMFQSEDLRQWYLPEGNDEQQSEEDIAGHADGSLGFASNSQITERTTLNRSLSAFESERMVEQTTILLQSTDPADQGRIEKVIGQWESLIAEGATQPNSVVNVILDYYARSGDTANAIKWLARLDLTNPTNVPKGLNQLLISLAEKDDPSAIWRAEEILRQLESSGGGNSLDPAAYAAVAERWLQTNESQAYRRVMELCFRPDKFDARLVSVLLRGLRREKEVSADMVNQVLEWFTKQHDSLSMESRRELVEGILFVLQRHGKGWRAWELFRSELENGLEVNEKLCELVVASMPNSADPNDVMKIFQFLESKNIELDIGFFLEASKRLADMKQKERLEQLMALYQAVLERLRRGSIDPKSTTLPFFYKSVFELINYWKRDDIALGLINEMETSLACQLPISCYSSTAHTLSYKGKLEPTKILYHRLRKYYDAGYKNLHPDALFYLSLARLLSTRSIANSSKIDAVFDGQLSLLDELKQHYKSTGNEQYKPLPGMYKTLLSSLTKMKPTEETAAKANILLKEMISLNAVDKEDPDPFTMAMHVIMTSPRKDEFPLIAEIRQNMIDLGVRDSDLVFVNCLRACTRTQSNVQRQQGLLLAVRTIHQFRTQNQGAESEQGPKIYSLAFASLFRNFGSNDSRAAPIVTKVFEQCCEDGYLTPQIVKQIQGSNNVTKAFFDRLYSDRLLYGGREPLEWSRNILFE